MKLVQNVQYIKVENKQKVPMSLSYTQRDKPKTDPEVEIFKMLPSDWMDFKSKNKGYGTRVGAKIPGQTPLALTCQDFLGQNHIPKRN